MKKKLKWVLFAVVITLLATSCTTIRRENLDFSIRMTAEQIRQGSFTGGRLIYSENGLNHLETGNLIPILDKTQAFIPLEDGETFEFKTIEEKYGYYYVVSAAPDALTLDFLLYDSEGKILEHEEGIVLHNGELLNRSGTAMANDSIDTTHYKLAYAPLNATDGISSRELQGASLLSFPNDTPTEEEQKYFDTEKRYRTVLFRLQESGTQPYAYTSGVIAAHETEPFLIIDSRYYDESTSHDDHIKLKDPDIPQLEIGDYILDSSTSTARVVTGLVAEDDINGFITFHTNDIHIQKAVSAMRVQVEGDLGELIERHGSQSDKDWLHQVMSARSDYDLWDAQATASLWRNDGPVELELDYDIHLGVNMSFTSDITWDRVSASGSFSIDTKADLDLIFDLFAVDPGSDQKGTFVTIPLQFEISKFKVGGKIKVVADYESENSTSSMHYKTSMKTGECKLGFAYDVGAKLTYIWGFIPFPQAWCDCHEIYSPFDGASFHFEGTELKDMKENALDIGVAANFELNLFGGIIFSVDGNLGIKTAFVKKPLQAYDWWADVDLYGSLGRLKFGVGVPFTSIGYTWDLGTLFSVDPEAGHIVSIPLDDLMEDD